MSKRHSPRFISIVEQVRSRVPELTIRQVKARQDSGEEFHLVDVREESEWAAGRLPGAIHLSKGVIERDIEKAIPDTLGHIVCYCGGGFRSALAVDNLRVMGYRNVWSMAGGFSGWQGEGLPVE